MHDLALHSSGRASGAGGACLFGLSLCSGAGGLDLGLAIAIPGYRAVGHVERDAYAAATLVARMEDASLDQAVVWDDVGTFDGRPWRGAVDIVTAGYPCQPFSVAGKRRGADEPRHLWPHVARIIGEIKPPFVFLENVAHPRSGLIHVDLGSARQLGERFPVPATAFAKDTPPARDVLAQSRTIRCGAAGGVATLGAAEVEVAQHDLTQTQTAILPLVPYLDALRWLFIAVALCGNAVTIYARLDDWRRGQR